MTQQQVADITSMILDEKNWRLLLNGDDAKIDIVELKSIVNNGIFINYRTKG